MKSMTAPPTNSGTQWFLVLGKRSCRSAGVDVFEDEQGARVDNTGDRLQHVEDDPTQVGIVVRPHQEDHVELSADQRNVMHLGDVSQGVAQFPPGILPHLHGDVGGCRQPRFLRIDDSHEPGDHTVVGEAG